jgi:hypothetical protein
MTVDAVMALHRIELGAILRENFAAARDAVFTHQQIEIFPERLGEFRLRVHQIHDLEIRRQPARLRIIRRARNAAARGFRPQPFKALAEIRGRIADRIRAHQRMTRGAGFSAPLGLVAARRISRRGRNHRITVVDLRAAGLQRSQDHNHRRPGGRK